MNAVGYVLEEETNTFIEGFHECVLLCRDIIIYGMKSPKATMCSGNDSSFSMSFDVKTLNLV